MKVITGYIQVDSMHNPVDFEFEVEGDWNNLTEEQKEEIFYEAVNESGLINCWYKED